MSQHTALPVSTGMVGPARPGAGRPGSWGKAVALVSPGPTAVTHLVPWGRSESGKTSPPHVLPLPPTGALVREGVRGRVSPSDGIGGPGSELQESQGLPALHTILALAPGTYSESECRYE